MSCEVVIRCTKCKLCKPPEEFYKHSTSSTGRQSRCKDCSRVSSREWRDGNHARSREIAKKSYETVGFARYIERTYGLTIDKYDQMLIDQCGRCASCDDLFGEKKPDIDHCHETGVVRALLCHGCNVGLGYFQESPDKLRMAATYLERHSF